MPHIPARLKLSVICLDVNALRLLASFLVVALALPAQSAPEWKFAVSGDSRNFARHAPREDEKQHSKLCAGVPDLILPRGGSVRLEDTVTRLRDQIVSERRCDRE